MESVPNCCCVHLDQIRPQDNVVVEEHDRKLPFAKRSVVCEDCIREDGSHAMWLHLRQCQICGHIGCCDSSPRKHATAHFHTSRHPIVKSVEPGESWGWCYLDQMELEFTPLPVTIIQP